MIELIYRYDPRSTPPPSPATPAEARQRLCQGNREFVGLVDADDDRSAFQRIIPFDLRDLGVAESAGVAPWQQPFAVVLGCSDARAPTEMIFSQACNALFVVRVAGNVLGHECLGSIDYAVQHLGDDLKLLVVLGHSGCGAVTAAVDIFLDPAHYLTVASTHALRDIVDSILVAVRAAAYSLEQVHGRDVTSLAGYRAPIETSVALNAALTARTLRHEFREADADHLQVCYGVYHLVSREVSLPLASGSDGQPALFDPPTDAEAFRQLGVQLASCSDTRQLLRGAG